MSQNNQPLSGSAVTPTQRVSLNSSLTNVILDSDPTNSSFMVEISSLSIPALYIDKYGNVGLNTTSPGAQLEIASNNGSCIRMRYGDTASIGTMNIESDGKVALEASGGEIYTNGNFNVAGHNGTSTGLMLADTLITASGAQLNYTKVTPGTATASKALVLDSGGHISGIVALSATTLSGTLSTSAQPNINSLGVLSSLSVGGDTVISSVSDATNSLTGGALTVSGGMAVNKSAFVGGNLTVSGNLLVNGSSTIINSSAVSIDDNTLILNVSPTASDDSGLIITRYQSSNDTADGNVVTDTPSFATTISSPTSTSVVLASGSGVNGYYQGWWAQIGSLVRRVASYVGSTRVLTVDEPFTSTPSNGAIITLFSHANATFVWRESTKQFVTGFAAMDASASLSITDAANLATGALSASGQIAATNAADATSDATGSLTVAGGVGIAKTLYVGTGIYGTARTAAQPYITSLGTLTSLAVTGGISAASFTGVVQTASQPNITSLGTLNALSVVGSSDSISVANASANSSANMLMTSDTFSAAVGVRGTDSSSNPGTFYISYNGVNCFLSDSSGKISIGTNSFGYQLNVGGSLNANSLYVGGTVVDTSLISGVTVGEAAPDKVLTTDASLNVSGIDTLSATTLTGQLSTADQPNITSIGQLTTLQIGSATLTATNAAYIDGATPGTALASKSLVLDASKGISGLGSVGIANTVSTGVAAQSFTTDANTMTIGVRGSTNATNPNAAYISYGGSTQLLMNTSGDVSIGAGAFGYKMNVGGTVNATEYYLNGSVMDISGSAYTSSVTPGTAMANKAMILDSDKSITSITSIETASITVDGVVIGATQAGYISGIAPGTASANTAVVLDADGSVTDINSLSVQTLLVDGASISAASYEYLSDITAGAAAPSKAMVLDSMSNIVDIGSLTASTIVIGTQVLTSVQAEYLTSLVSGVAQASKALVLNTSRSITSGIQSLAMDSIVIDDNTIGSEAAFLAGATAGSAANNKVLVLGPTGGLTGIAALGISGSNTQPLTLTNTNSSSAISQAFVSDVYTLSMGVNGSTNATNPNCAYLYYSDAYALVINSSGNMAVGTSPSSHKLNVGGAINASGYSLSGTAINFGGLAYVNGVTPGAATASLALVLNSSKGITGITSLSTDTIVVNGASISDEAVFLAGATAGAAVYGKALVLSDTGIVTGIASLSTTSLVVGSQTLGSTQAAFLVGVGAGTAVNGKALILGAGGAITGISSFGTDAIVLDGTQITATAEQINYLSGVTTPGTAVGSSALVVDASKNISGIGLLGSSTLTIGGTAVSKASWLTTGAQLDVQTAIYTNTNTASSGTAASATFASFQRPTLAATNTNVTTTNAATVYIQGAPISGTNMTVTNPYSLWIASGRTFLADSTTSSSTSTGALVVTGGVGIGGALNVGGASSLASNVDITAHDGSSTGLRLGGALITASAAQINVLNGVTASTAELNYLDIATAGVAQASKAVVVDSSINISDLNIIKMNSDLYMSQTAVLRICRDVSTGDLNSTIYSDGIASLCLSSVRGGGVVKIFTNASTTNACFSINNASSGTNHLTFTADSKCGLYTNTPGYGLDVQGSFNATSLYLGGTQLTATAAEHNVLTGATAGTAVASKALVVDASKNITALNNLTAVNQITVARTTDGSPWRCTNGTSALSAYLYTSGDVYFGTTSTGTNLIIQAGNSNRMIINGTTGEITSVVSIDSGAYKLAGATILASALTGITAGAPAASKALTLDASSSLNGNLTMTGTLTAGTISLTSGTASTSTSTGALVVTGGVGISGATFIGTTLNAAGITSLTSGTASTSTTSGTLVVTGGAGVSGSLFVGGNVDITTHNGSTTGLKLGGNIVTATATELNYVDVTTVGTAQATKALVTDSNKNIYGIGNMSLGATGSGTSWGTAGIQFNAQAATYTNGRTAGTDTSAVTASFAQSTFASTNLVTVSTAATLYIQGAPLAGTNTTISNSFALWAAAGKIKIDDNTASSSAATGAIQCAGGAYFGANTLVGASTASSSATTGALVVTGGVGIGGVLTAGGDVNILSHNGSSTGLKLNSTLVTASAAELNVLKGITASTAELNYVDITTAGTAQATKALVTDSNKNIYGIGNMSFGAAGSGTSWGTAGIQFNAQAATYNNARAAGTDTSAVVASFAQSTFTATNAVTVTNAATLYIQGAPIASTNTIFTNSYALWAAAGKIKIDDNTASSSAATGAIQCAGGAYFGANTLVGASTASSSATTGALVVTGGVGIGGTLNVTTAAVVGGVDVGANLAPLVGITLGTPAASKALTLNGSSQIAGGLTLTGALGCGAINATGMIKNTSTANGVTFSSVNGTSTCNLYHYNNGIVFWGTTTPNSLLLMTNNAPQLTIDGTTGAISVAASISTPILTVTASTASTTTGTGALVVTGGVGIGGATYIGGTLNVAGTISGTLASGAQSGITAVGTLTGLTSSGAVTFTANTASTTTGTGTLVVTGGVGVSGALNAGSVQSSTIKIGSSLGDQAMNYLTNSATDALFRFGKQLATNDCITLRWASATQAFSFDMYGSSNALCINSSGVGIGTSTIAYKLAINGSINATSYYQGGTLCDFNTLAVTAGTASASKALILDSSKNISGINSLGTNTLNMTPETTFNTSVLNSSANGSTSLNNQPATYGYAYLPSNNSILVVKSSNTTISQLAMYVTNENTLNYIPLLNGSSNLAYTLSYNGSSITSSCVAVSSGSIYAGATVFSSSTSLYYATVVIGTTSSLDFLGSPVSTGSTSRSIVAMAVQSTISMVCCTLVSGTTYAAYYFNASSPTSISPALRNVWWVSAWSKFIGTTTSGIYYSSNGTTWTLATTIPGTMAYSASAQFTHNTYLSIGVMASSTSLIYSTDGINWYDTTRSFSGAVGTVMSTESNFQFIASISSTQSAYSLNGINWTTVTISNSAVFGNGSVSFFNSSNNYGYSYSSTYIQKIGPFTPTPFMQTINSTTGYLQNQASTGYTWSTLSNVNSAGTQVMSLSPTGSLMLGTSTDTARMISALDGNMSNDATRYITFGKLNSSKNQCEFAYTHKGDGLSANYVGFGFHSTGNVLTITAGQKVGIGTDTPSFPLHITAGTTASGSLTISYYDYARTAANRTVSGLTNISLFCTGRIICQDEIGITSDRRIKENISLIDLTTADHFLDNVIPVRYSYKSDSGRKNLGYIAQDVFKSGLVEELISYTDNPDLEEEIGEDGFVSPEGIQFGVITGNIIPLLHVKVKSLSDTNKALQAQVSEMEARMQRLEQIIEQLQR